MLTEKQERILDIIKNYIDKEKIPPTVREICKLAGINSTSSVQAHIDRLEKKGYIKKDKGCNRSIRIKEII